MHPVPQDVPAGGAPPDQDRRRRSSLLIVSGLFGTAAAYVVFVLFLQSAVLSAARLAAIAALAVGLALAHHGAAARWLLPRLEASRVRHSAGLGLLLAALFLPLLYRPPAYPLSPILRPWSDLAVQYELDPQAQPVVLDPQAVRLVMGRQALDLDAFQLAGAWERDGARLRLAPGTTASLRWTGTLPETTVLSIQPPAGEVRLTVYWDGMRTSTDLGADRQSPVVMTRKASLPPGFNAAFLLSCFVLGAWGLGLAALLLGPRTAMLERPAGSRRFAWGLALLAVLLAALTVRLQLDSLSGGLQYLATEQLPRHAAVLQGSAPDPWQYRLLSEWMVEGLIRLYRLTGAPGAAQAAMISLRLLQNVAIFLAAYALYVRASGSRRLGLLGILLLAAGMANAYYDNDLSFNTYFDLLFYLLGMLLLLSRRYGAVVILTLLAALNRETSGLIPFMLVGALFGDNTRHGPRKYMPALLSFVVFAGVIAGVRLAFPPRPLYVPYRHAPGIPLLLYNVTRSFTWQQLFATLGLAPLVGLLFFRDWPPFWQRLLFIMCPLWFLIHSFASVMAETRLFLAPQALVFIPGALFAVRAWQRGRKPAALPSLDHSSGAL